MMAVKVIMMVPTTTGAFPVMVMVMMPAVASVVMLPL
jgi:hypothetical protein